MMNLELLGRKILAIFLTKAYLGEKMCKMLEFDVCSTSSMFP